MTDLIPRTRDELDELFGSDDHRSVVPIGPRIERKAAEKMPEAGAMAQEQFQQAVYRLHEDMSSYPQFPWPKLADLSGPMCPEDLILVAARTGGGKSLFLQNLFDSLITAGRFGLYIGLEQSASILRTKWACLRTDVAPRLVLATRPNEHGTPQWEGAMAAVQADLKWQQTPEVRQRAHFASTRKINARGLKTWTEWGVDLGCEFVIVDHVDRIQHGDGKNSFHEVSETVRLAKELAVEHRIVMLMASQVGRPGDSMEQFMPPSLHSMRGAGTKEEEADTVIGVYRPIKVGVDDSVMKQVRQGLRPRDDVIEPNVMGVMLLKHRLDGPVAGQSVKLAVRHQRVMPMREADQWTTTEGPWPRQIV